MNNIILIEDHEDFAKQFILSAKSKAINTTYKKSLDGLKTIIPKHESKFAAIILDIKCLLHDDQEREDSNFIGAAMTYLDQTVPRFPRFILTGDDSEFENLGRYYSEEKIFLKTPQSIDELFNEIQICIENSEALKIKRNFTNAFEIFENGWMDHNGEQQLLKIIKAGLNEKQNSNFKGILADIRSMQERIYKTISSKNNRVVPDSMFKANGMIIFNKLMKHLSGNPNKKYEPTSTVYQNNTIHNMANMIYWSSSEFIHEDIKRDYIISDSAIKSMTYALLEILVWSKQYLMTR